jgi:hypothetical protein
MLRPPCTAREISRRTLWSNPLCDSSIAFESWMLQEVRSYPSEVVSEDFDLWSRAIPSGKATADVPELLMRYRFHAA